MKITPYLMFNGQAKEAFQFYEQCFGGKIVASFTHAETPAAEHSPPEMQDLIMHICLDLGDGSLLMASDCSAAEYEKPQGVMVSLHPETPEEAERIFAALAEGGAVQMPIQETFWSPRFGMVTDRFGIPWMVNTSPAAEA